MSIYKYPFGQFEIYAIIHWGNLVIPIHFSLRNKYHDSSRIMAESSQTRTTAVSTNKTDFPFLYNILLWLLFCSWLGLTSHQHCKGYMVTFQLYRRRKTSSALPYVHFSSFQARTDTWKEPPTWLSHMSPL